MSFPRYASYKDSGVEWLGEVPTGWAVEPLKRLAAVIPSNVDKKTFEGERAVQLCNYTDVYYNDLITCEITFMEASASDEQIGRFGLRAGDVILTKDSEAADDIAISAYVPADLPCVVCGYHLAILRSDPSVADGAFLKRYFDSAFAKASVAVRANGLTRVGLGQYALDNLQIPTPSVAEQRAIADFLGRETAKIDALVEAQRRLIALLKEKRQAVISHAVTKGLDPSAPLKPSGIPWLGDVPGHWEVMTLGRVLSRIEQGWSPAAHDRRPDPAEASVLRLSAIKDGRFYSDERKALPELTEEELASSPIVRADDFLLTRANTPDLVGDCAIASECEHTIFSDLIYRISFRPLAFPEFMLLVLRSAALRAQIRNDARGSSMSMAKLSHGHLKSWWIALPPTDEQYEIVRMTGDALTRLARLTDRAEAAIALLTERRAALISAAVTGKIDVRGLVAQPQPAEAA